jgi:hypothetical protein
MIAVGDTVKLLLKSNTSDPHPLHRAEAKVIELTDWGAFVHCKAAATNQFRALFEEMEMNGSSDKILEAAINSGYTGEFCIHCGGCRMRRNGNCQLCDDCGITSSCS